MAEVGRERADDRSEAEQDGDQELEPKAGDVLLAASVPVPDVHVTVPAHGRILPNRPDSVRQNLAQAGTQGHPAVSASTRVPDGCSKRSQISRLRHILHTET